MEYLTIALAKGRLAELAVEIFLSLGYDCGEMLTKTRKLIFTDEEHRMKFLLVKALILKTKALIIQPSSYGTNYIKCCIALLGSFKAGLFD